MRKHYLLLVKELDSMIRIESNPILFGTRLMLRLDASGISPKGAELDLVSSSIARLYERSGIPLKYTTAEVVETFQFLEEQERVLFSRMVEKTRFKRIGTSFVWEFARSPFRQYFKPILYTFEENTNRGYHIDPPEWYNPDRTKEPRLRMDQLVVQFVMDYRYEIQKTESEYLMALSSRNPQKWIDLSSALMLDFNDCNGPKTQSIIFEVIEFGSDAVFEQVLITIPWNQFINAETSWSVFSKSILSKKVERFRRFYLLKPDLYDPIQFISFLWSETTLEMFQAIYSIHPFDDRVFLQGFNPDDSINTKFDWLLDRPGFDINRYTGDQTVMTFILKYGRLPRIIKLVDRGANLMNFQIVRDEKTKKELYKDYVFASAFDNVDGDERVIDFVMQHVPDEIRYQDISIIRHLLEFELTDQIENCIKKNYIRLSYVRKNGKFLLKLAKEQKKKKSVQFLKSRVFCRKSIFIRN